MLYICLIDHEFYAPGEQASERWSEGSAPVNLNTDTLFFNGLVVDNVSVYIVAEV